MLVLRNGRATFHYNNVYDYDKKIVKGVSHIKDDTCRQKSEEYFRPGETELFRCKVKTTCVCDLSPIVIIKDGEEILLREGDKLTIDPNEEFYVSGEYYYTLDNVKYVKRLSCLIITRNF